MGCLDRLASRSIGSPMQRDPDILRKVLLEVEGLDGDQPVAYSSQLDDDDPAFVYHLALLVEEGYVKGRIDGDDQDVWAWRLTWTGHDLLDAIRSETIWSKTKARVSKTAGTVSIGALKAVAESVAKEMLGLG